MNFTTAARTGLISATQLTGSIVSVLTSRRASRIYQAIWKYTVLCTQGAIAITLLLGYASFTLGYAFKGGCDRLAVQCLLPEVELILALPEPPSPTAALPAEIDVDDVWAEVEAVAIGLRTLITPPALIPFAYVPMLPPAKIEPTAALVKQKRKGGRKRKTS